MGLDMYLTGVKRYASHTGSRMEDGFEVESLILELGYWRKHANLHGFIVQNFADNKDECQEIELNADDINAIIEAIEKDELPATQGFFFGYDGYDPKDEKEADLLIFGKALGWMTMEIDNPPPWMKSIVYRASW